MVVAGFVAGFLVAAGLWVLAAPAFASPAFERQNFRGRSLPTAAGVVVVLAVLLLDAVLAVAVGAGYEPAAGTVAGFRLATVVALGFGLLGLLDDLGGVGQSGGFTGHLKALAAGRLTTGGIKLFGGAAVALVVVSTWTPDPGLGRLLADAALVALAANLGNLFDRAPGRTIKVTLVAFLVLVLAVGAQRELAGVALAVGAGAGLLTADLRERLMLGDAGANVLGAVLGLGVVLTCSPGVRTAALVLVALLNLASEWVSFSRVIAAAPPLRAADRWGRLP
jgi:UDP-N-acetylmuramyl pentapeptide phosphotransferase/UDP-N-acetylglucosamine-1-phosphate transferase